MQLADIKSSNAQISTALPSGLVAVFVGGTNGIGEATLLKFAKYASKPRCYFVGRSQEAADRITAECKSLNPHGQFTFIKLDVSLIRNVDSVCADIKAKEKTINILCLSVGILSRNTDTEEGLHLFAALPHYSRARFIQNLLPLIQEATGLRRVLTIAGGTKEGNVYEDDFQVRNVSLVNIRGHLSSILTLTLESFAKSAPSVAFMHSFPGAVKSGITRGATGIVWLGLMFVFNVLGPFLNIPSDESGERHVYLLTSNRYCEREKDAASTGIPLPDNIPVASGTDGEVGSGVYSVGETGNEASPQTQKILAGLRDRGLVEKVRDDLEGEFLRITANK